jgi:hypothetical protein
MTVVGVVAVPTVLGLTGCGAPSFQLGSAAAAVCRVSLESGLLSAGDCTRAAH